MSTLTTRDAQSNFITADRDLNKIFVEGNDYQNAVFNNDTGAEVELVGGEVLARNPANGKVLWVDSAKIDGSQFPIAVNKTCATVANGADANILMCVLGKVEESKLVFQGSDDLDTVISNKTMRDRLQGESVGIFLVLGEDQTKFDN